MLVVLLEFLEVVLSRRRKVRLRERRGRNWRRCILYRGMVGLEYLEEVRVVLGERCITQRSSRFRAIQIETDCTRYVHARW